MKRRGGGLSLEVAAALVLVAGLALAGWGVVGARRARLVAAQAESEASQLSAEAMTLERDPGVRDLPARIASLRAGIAAAGSAVPTSVTGAELVSLVMGAAARDGVRVQSVVIGSNGQAPGGLTGTEVDVEAEVPSVQAEVMWLYDLEHGPVPAVAPVPSLALGGGVQTVQLVVTYYSRDGLAVS